MRLFEGKTPQERYKIIAALVLGAVALLFLARMMFGSSSPTPARNTNARGGRATATGPAQSVQPAADNIPDISLIPEIRQTAFDGTEGGRNIFAFYEPPVKKVIDPATIATPTPTPTPPPPLLLATLAPTNVYAQSGDFTLAVTGDKFTPQTRIYIDSQEVPTTFANAQQLTANVPAMLISAPGTRTVIARTPDGQLYSNPMPLNVGDPPKPQYTYIGLLGGARYNDKAMLKSQSNEVVTVQRGDVVGGRFRVTSISERAVDFTDTQLKIKHTLPYVEMRTGGPGGPRPYIPQPPPRSGDDDDEPEP
ncbi:MAG TPA: IPT/TIG domain-containing protein [Pyrinomonadaceae bacterium]|jgi:hypothetical protein